MTTASDWAKRHRQTPYQAPVVPMGVAPANVTGYAQGQGNAQAGATEAYGVNPEEAQANRDYYAQLNAWQDEQNQNNNPSGGSPRGGYGRGGGGGGTAAKKKAGQTKIDTLLALLNSQTMKSPQQTYEVDTLMRQQLADAGAADDVIRNREFDSLDEYVAGLGNQFADAPRAQAANLGGGTDLAALLGSQGAGSGTLSAEAEFLASQAQGQADIQNRLNDRLAAGQGAWNQSVGTEAKQARTYAGERAAARQRGLEMQIAAMDQRGQKQTDDQNFQLQLADRQNLMKMITEISGIAADAGIDNPNMDIDALMKAMGY